jgi:hypothetical protein
MRLSSSSLLLAGSLIPIASAVSQTGPAAAVASPDGAIVPFSSALPPCASQCGPLFDVQGYCEPPPGQFASPQACFCADARLQPILQSGTAGVSAACKNEGCQDAADLGKIQSWYAGYCKKAVANPATTTAGAPASTSTSKSGTSEPVSTVGGNQTWYGVFFLWFVVVEQSLNSEIGYNRITDGLS